MKKLIFIMIAALGLQIFGGSAAFAGTEATGIKPLIEFGFVYTCKAVNRRGEVFSAKADSRREAEWRALDRCERYSHRRCSIQSCKKKFDIDP
jgi:hypothetical protein